MVPPQSLEAEQATLGSMMLEREAIVRAVDLLKPEDFYQEGHRVIYEAITSLFSEGIPVDLVTLGERLSGQGQLEQVGGMAYLTSLLEAAPTAANVQHYARIVKKAAQLRQLRELGENLFQEASRTQTGELGELIANFRGKWEALASEEGRGSDGLAVLPYSELLSGELPEIPWLVEGLLVKGSLAVLGGDAGSGKTWVAQHLAQCVAAGLPLFGQFPCAQGPVLIWDEESTRPMLDRRIQKLHTGLGLDGAELPISLLLGLGLRLDDELSFGKLRAVLAKVRPVLVTGDSLVRMHSKDENSATEMAQVFERARALAREFGFVFLFTHHSRKFSEASNRTSQLLRGSTDIRAAVDTHLFLRQPVKGQLLIEHEKSRYSESLPRFSVRFEDSEDGAATLLTYEGEAEETEDRVEQAKEFALAALADEGGRMDRPSLIQRARAEGIPQRTVDRAMKQLVPGTIEKRKDGRRVVFCLKSVPALV